MHFPALVVPYNPSLTSFFSHLPFPPFLSFCPDFWLVEAPCAVQWCLRLSLPQHMPACAWLCLKLKLPSSPPFLVCYPSGRPLLFFAIPFGHLLTVAAPSSPVPSSSSPFTPLVLLLFLPPLRYVIPLPCFFHCFMIMIACM